jgi:nitrogen fixation protein FixH
MSDVRAFRGSAAARQSAWRWFPWLLAAAMLMVFAVNGSMVYFALHTFPGAANNDGFDESNSYARVLAGVAKQEALGWSATATASGDRAELRLTDREGRALAGVAVAATAARPLGPPRTTELAFREAAAGRYVATVPLPEQGQWDLMLRVDAGERQFRATRRILVR